MLPTARSAAARPADRSAADRLDGHGRDRIVLERSATIRPMNGEPIPFDLAVEAAFVARDGRVLEVLRDDVATTVLALDPAEVDARVLEYRMALRDLGARSPYAWIARRLADLEAARDQARAAVSS